MGQNRLKTIRNGAGIGLLLALAILSGIIGKPKKWRHSDVYTLVGKYNFWKEFEPFNPDGSINVVVEIPAGSSEKWKVSKSGNEIAWEFNNGHPAEISYLAYPCNIGIVPQTANSRENGKPISVAVLGKAIPRGSVVPVKIISSLCLRSNGEQDDFIITVPLSGPLSKANNLKELNNYFPEITTILQLWFRHYQGRDNIVVEDFRDTEDTHQIVMNGYQEFLNLNND